jgi:effector-binding domain-containing protein
MTKMLKYLIGTLSGILILFIAAMFLSPKNMIIESSVKIEAPAAVCFNLVNDLSNWPLWSPWSNADPDAVLGYSDDTKGVGAKFSWKGDKSIGEGAQTIIYSSKTDSIALALEFNGASGESFSSWTFKPSGKKTVVSWNFKSADVPLPIRPLMLLNKGPLKRSYKEGLKNLKNIAEERAKKKIYRGYKINETRLEEKHYVMNRQLISIDNVQQFYSQNLGALFNQVQEADLKMDGMPCGLFFSYDELRKKTDMAAAIPVEKEVNLKNAQNITLPENRAIQIDFYGPYEGLSKAHDALKDYIEDYELKMNYPIIEEYLTEPGSDSDPSEWQTKLSYYIVEK